MIVWHIENELERHIIIEQSTNDKGERGRICIDLTSISKTRKNAFIDALNGIMKGEDDDRS